jgi:UDP-N-acetylglucosamine 4,6-dehydratase
MTKLPRVTIFGGTGTIGTALVERHYEDWDITIFSRDEYKQATLGQRFPKLKFIIGDVADLLSVETCFLPKSDTLGVPIDKVIFAAAMKRIEKCEQHPIAAVSTNVTGAENVVRCCLKYGVKMISITTDKAVEPVNVYGMTKAIQERIVTSAGFNCARYGNVFGSRGSVVPLYLDLKAKGEKLPITDDKMTRFILPKAEALDLIEIALSDSGKGRIFVANSPSARITDIAYAIGGGVKFIGRGSGEKLHECLVSEEETDYTYLLNDRWMVIDRDKRSTARGLPKFEGTKFTSDTNPKFLTVGEIQCLIGSL